VGHKVVALTFDDGPWRGSTDKIVRILKNADVQATFFMLGAQVKGQPLRAKSVADAGNQVAVHSWKHANMARRSSSKNAADLKRCIAVTKQATGVTPKWFRPPGGSTSSALRRTAASVGLRQVIWSTDTLDWRIRNKASITKRAVNGVRNGGVTLMHDGGGNRSATVAALPGIIATLRAKGYDFVTLDELVALGYKPK
jgi:peptidoglycan/xylan/chitin deacetylase (PgdA/CDA1 family)